MIDAGFTIFWNYLNLTRNQMDLKMQLSLTKHGTNVESSAISLLSKIIRFFLGPVKCEFGFPVVFNCNS